MAETKKKYRLFRVAKELNTGSSTLVEHLSRKGFAVNNAPNEKLSEEMYMILLKDFASEKILKKKAEQIKVAKQEKRLRSEEPEVEEQEEKILTAADIREGALDRDKSKPAPRKESETKPEAKAPAEPSKKDNRFSTKVLGKIDLSQFDRKKGRSRSKPEDKKSPVAKKPDPVKPASKPETKPPVSPAAETKAPPTKKPETPVQNKPVVNQPPAADGPSKSSLRKEREGNLQPPTPQKPAAKVDPPANSPEEKKPEDNKAVEPKVIRAADQAKTLGGLKILGKMDLGPDRKRGGAKKDEKSGTTAEKTEGDGAKRKRKRRRKRKSTTGTTVSSGNNNNNRGGDNNRRRGGNTGGGKKKEEQSDKEISEIIKNTLADLNKKKPSGRGRGYRRSKREAHRDKRDKELMQQMAQARNLEVTEFITANDLADLMNVAVTEIITKCMELGLFVSINQRLEADVIQLLAEEYGYGVEFVDLAEKDFEEAMEVEEDPALMEERPPIVTVMGHVDHGKTSLLDYIRSANIVAGEAGGITQHIGAYEVELDADRSICFLDTPGHEAFTAMRARGAKVTDLAIIVVAADDSVMPQTKEAINHSKSADVSMIFALNKVDKPGADPDRIRTQLSEMNILLEDWGGDYQAQEISAKTGQGIDDLLEKVLAEAELMELKANPEKPARGTVIEARLDKGRGVVATILVQDGTLKVGDTLVAGIHSARVRAMMDERGNRVSEAGPSTPVQILGLSGTPQAGDRFLVYEDPSKAREIAQRRNELYREQSLRKNTRPTLEELARRRALGDFKELNIIVKGDVDGSVEALSDSLLRLSVDEVQVNVIHKAVGQISEADVLLASASDAIIIGFQVRPSINARKTAENEGIDIRLYSVIYDAINEVKDALEGLLSPDVKEEIMGSAEIRDVFRISKVGNIAGCYVLDGKMSRKDPIRLIRDGIVIYNGKLGSLKRFKDDVREVSKGYECGMQIEGYNDIKIGDVIEQYRETEVARKLR
ncbi:MAG: translation initiation factor IF-2 [Bacteroidota bacterium]